MTTYALSPIRTDADYRTALSKIEPLFDTDVDPDSAEGMYFDAMITLIEAYEAKHYPIDPPDPIDAIKFRMDQSGLAVKDLVPYIGPINRVYEVLARKRQLSITMIRRLSTGLHIPADVLIRERIGNSTT